MRACTVAYRVACIRTAQRDARLGQNEMYSQANQTRLETVLEEYPLFPLSPLNVLHQDVDLNLLAIWDGAEAVEECPD